MTWQPITRGCPSIKIVVISIGLRNPELESEAPPRCRPTRRRHLSPGKPLFVFLAISPGDRRIAARMGIDHSATYRDKSLKNLVHRHRLRTILSIIERDLVLDGRTLADVGCSNGYLTALMNERFKPSLARGYDHDPDNLARARASHPGIEFETIDLNTVSTPGRQVRRRDVFRSTRARGRPPQCSR